MLQVIACVFIGRYFSQLAFDNNRNRWGAGILAGLGAFVLQMLFSFLLQIFVFPATDGSFGATIIASLIGIGIGTALMYPIYKALERTWEGNPKDGKSSDLLDN